MLSSRRATRTPTPDCPTWRALEPLALPLLDSPRSWAALCQHLQVPNSVPSVGPSLIMNTGNSIHLSTNRLPCVGLNPRTIVHARALPIAIRSYNAGQGRGQGTKPLTPHPLRVKELTLIIVKSASGVIPECAALPPRIVEGLALPMPPN